MIAYLDAFSGISGDMLVGALADAGAAPERITELVDSLGTGARLSFEKVKRAGIAATKFHVAAEETARHRHLPQILRMIEGSALPGRSRHNAAAVFQRLGEAEAAVHGVPIEQVHFHEVGAVDSIVDIVGACVALELLGVEEVFCSAVNVGCGTVDTDHGLLPVPAPATAALLAGKPVYARGPEAELTTPTGAAVAATLALRFGAMPAMTVARIGYGAGDRDFKEQANVLRVLIGQPSGATEATTVCVIEANLDDCNPQVLAYAVERLLETGALDATLQPLQMKKGRPGVLLRAVTRPEDREAAAELIFRETSTLGLRMYDAQRRVQARRWEQVATPWGPVRVKIGEWGRAPEFEDCRRVALAAGVPLREVMAAALGGNSRPA